MGCPTSLSRKQKRDPRGSRNRSCHAPHEDTLKTSLAMRVHRDEASDKCSCHLRGCPSGPCSSALSLTSRDFVQYVVVRRAASCVLEKRNKDPLREARNKSKVRRERNLRFSVCRPTGGGEWCQLRVRGILDPERIPRRHVEQAVSARRGRRLLEGSHAVSPRSTERSDLVGPPPARAHPLDRSDNA